MAQTGSHTGQRVADAAVVAQHDQQRGEVVKAFVVMRSGKSWDEERLREHCGEHLSKYKRPRVYEQCHGDLPRNFLGKVIRRELREQENQTNGQKTEESK